VKKAIEYDNRSYSHITGLDMDQPINNDDENNFSESCVSPSQTVDEKDCISISRPGWNQHNISIDDGDCFSSSSPTSSVD